MGSAAAHLKQERTRTIMTDIALVTGGTRGIGAAIARSLKAEGHEVAAVYHGNDAAAARFKQDTGIPVFQWDVADEAACRDGVAQVEERLGPVSILINNAGITRDGVFHKMSWDNWRSVLATNLNSMFTMTRAIIEGMRERRFGRIINISSINGQKGQVGQVNYSAAKAGVIGFTKALSCRKMLRVASRSTPSAPVMLTPTWSPPSRRRCVPRSSPESPSDVSAIPTRSRKRSPISPRQRRLSARARCLPSTEGNISPMANLVCDHA